MRLFGLMVLGGVLALLGASPADAACSKGAGKPAGVEGEILYNANWKVMQFCDGSGWRSMGTAGVSVGVGDPGELQFKAEDGGLAADGQLKWDNINKRLSIGGASHKARLSITGDAAATGGWSNTGLTIKHTGASPKEFSISVRPEGTLVIGDETSAVTRFRIFSDGKIVLGNTTPSTHNVTVAGTLSATGGLRMDGADFEMYNTGRCGMSCEGRGRALVHDHGDVLVMNYAGDFSGGVTVQSSFAIQGQAYKPGGGDWVATSDARLKDVTGKYERGLDAVIALEPVTYRYKQGNARGEPTDTEFIGLVAQDVQQHIPEAVREGADGYLNLDSTPLQYAYINAIKALVAKNAALEARIEVLEKQLAKP